MAPVDVMSLSHFPGRLDGASPSPSPSPSPFPDRLDGAKLSWSAQKWASGSKLEFFLRQPLRVKTLTGHCS